MRPGGRESLRPLAPTAFFPNHNPIPPHSLPCLNRGRCFAASAGGGQWSGFCPWNLLFWTKHTKSAGRQYRKSGMSQIGNSSKVRYFSKIWCKKTKHNGAAKTHELDDNWDNLTKITLWMAWPNQTVTKINTELVFSGLWRGKHDHWGSICYERRSPTTHDERPSRAIFFSLLVALATFSQVLKVKKIGNLRKSAENCGEKLQSPNFGFHTFCIRETVIFFCLGNGIFAGSRWFMSLFHDRIPRNNHSRLILWASQHLSRKYLHYFSANSIPVGAVAAVRWLPTHLLFRCCGNCSVTKGTFVQLKSRFESRKKCPRVEKNCLNFLFVIC